jgi:hypothetical protein
VLALLRLHAWMHAMPSDAKVPDPQPRGITVPAVAVVVLVVTGAIWGVGLFLLGRQTAPPVEVLDRAGEAHVSALNRIDQMIAQGKLDDATAMLHSAVVPDGPIGKLALDLRQIRIVATAADLVRKEAEEAAKREAASPPAVLRRLQAHLWQIDSKAMNELTGVPTTKDEPAATTPAAPVESPTPSVALTPLKLGDETVVPIARLVHPTITTRVYALHPQKGVLRSDDSGVTWRVGLAPLQKITGTSLMFSHGEDPLIVIRGATCTLFADTEAAFFP